MLGATVFVAVTVGLALGKAAFGLGSSAYKQFNAMIKKVDSCLVNGGAQRIGKLGVGERRNQAPTHRVSAINKMTLE